MMFIELLLSSAKLLVIFTAIGSTILVLLFKLMAGTMSYYYKRDTGLVSYDAVVKDLKTISGKFKPVFHRVDVIPIGKKLIVKTNFSKKIKYEILVE